MEIWTAIALGTAGSLHCVGMCGPIALALPGGGQSRGRYIVGRVVYNAGRLITYTAMGLATGMVGQILRVGQYQQAASVAFGLFLLAAMILPQRLLWRLSPGSLIGRLAGRLRSAWAILLARHSLFSSLLIGFLNGFLPCGLVYVALAGAVTTGRAASGSLYMLLFGLGTFPVMLAVGLAGKLVGVSLKRRLARLVPIAGSLLAVLIILRGLSLGIPYVSPKIAVDTTGKPSVACCTSGAVDSTAATDTTTTR